MNEQALSVGVSTQEAAKWQTPTVTAFGGFQLIPQNLSEGVEIARLMAKAGCAVPAYMHDNPGAALAVAMQAWRWNMDPFAVASKTYLVENKKKEERIAYEAQLIAAVVNTRAGLRDKPEIEYEGEGQQRKCKVTFVFLSGAIRDYESPLISDIKTKNSPLWFSEPDQQLGYYSIRAAARRHCPEVILGVYDRDEIGSDEIRPLQQTPNISRHLSEATSQPAQGFGATDVDQEAKALSAPDPQENIAPTVNQTGPLEELDIPASLDRREKKTGPIEEDEFPGDREFDPERDEIHGAPS